MQLQLQCSSSSLLSDSALGAASSTKNETASASASASPARKINLDGLPHFEKNFYSESPSVRSMTEPEVTEYRLRREITVEGKDVPKPVKSFSDAAFPGTIL